MRIIDEVLRFLTRAVIVGAVLLVVVQGLMTNDKTRFYLSFEERIDGQQIKVPALAHSGSTIKQDKAKMRSGTVTLELADYSALGKAIVLVNGQAQASFTDRKVILPVQPGDMIEIDTTSYNKPVTFKVTAVSNNIAFPHPGILLISDGAITLLGEIKVR
ncbi:MAG: hypothetical protein ACM3UZ_00090 [Acidobacteriota bacterium]